MSVRFMSGVSQWVRGPARALAVALHRPGLGAGAVVTGLRARAWETAAEFRRGAGLVVREPEPCDLLGPEAGRRRKLAKCLAGVEVENLVIVGHDPDLPA